MKKGIRTLLIIICCGVMWSMAPYFALTTGIIDLTNLDDYENQSIPSYIDLTKDNTPGNNPITDLGATLGRVLFYDVALSNSNSTSCASCHQQEFAFSDPNQVSTGHLGGPTGRHSMRLVNARFSREDNFFWDERANSLEEQTTQPIQDHVEMGFSGTNGEPSIADLCAKLQGMGYYNILFTEVYGDATVTEARIQEALAQFIRSIQSFDSRYDEGLALAGNTNADFTNFTTEENLGKTLFMTPPNVGGAGCNACHQAPEFDISRNSGNNNVIAVVGNPAAHDLLNTRSPSLRDLVNPNTVLNGPMMHTGSFTTIRDVIDHYDNIDWDSAINPNLDNRLQRGGNGQRLNLTDAEKEALVAFLETLTGSDMYTNPKWSDPFDALGNLSIIGSSLPVQLAYFTATAWDETVLLEWATAQEFNSDYFEIEYSTDALNWQVLSEVLAAGTATDTQYYEWVHETPRTGDNYYRLVQVDVDGTTTHFAPQKVVFSEEENIFKVYPNPFAASVTIESNSTTDGLIQLHNASGQLVYQQSLAASTTGYTVSLPTHLSGGMYWLSLLGEDDQLLGRTSLVKQ